MRRGLLPLEPKAKYGWDTEKEATKSAKISGHVPPKRKTRVFVSYSRRDDALVRSLAALLGIAADRAVFLDVTSLEPGENGTRRSSMG